LREDGTLHTTDRGEGEGGKRGEKREENSGTTQDAAEQGAVAEGTGQEGTWMDTAVLY
jgi:hypothetical protein